MGLTATRHNGSNGLFETTGTAAGVDQGVSSAITISARLAMERFIR